MEKSPERRYPTARALAEELNRFLNHEPILARPASPLRKASSWARKHPWTFTSLATFIILGLMTLAYGLWEQNQLLHWQMAHPGKPKPVAEVLERFKEAKESVSLEVALAMNFFFLLYGIWMKRHWFCGTRPSPLLLWGVLLAGVLWTGWVLFCGARLIAAVVWADHPVVWADHPVFRVGT